MPKINNPRLLLAKLRNGDFAHAGDKEAIDIVLKKIFELIVNPNSCSESDLKSEMKALDVGCGLGGTAEYIRKAISFDMYGIDIDKSAIQHAKRKYSNIQFFEYDVMDIEKYLQKNQFSLIYLFNVFYALPQQKESLKHLAAIAKPGALLVIFDYTCNKQDLEFDLKDLAGKPMKPVSLHNLKKWLKDSGWNLTEIVDLTAEYERWYEEFLKLMIVNKEMLLKEFSDEIFTKVHDTFLILLNSLKNKKIMGSAVYAILNKNRLFVNPVPSGNIQDRKTVAKKIRSKF